MGGTSKQEYSGSSGPNPAKNKTKHINHRRFIYEEDTSTQHRELILITLERVHRVIKLTLIAYTAPANTNTPTIQVHNPW